MSNGDTRVDVSSEGEYHLKLAIQLALVYHTGDRGKVAEYFPGCTHWMVHDNAIWFGWNKSDGELADKTVPRLQPFPTKLGVDSLVAMILGWLRDGAAYPNEPDIDGSTYRGWRLVSHYTLAPDVYDRFYISFGVRPEWMEYHK